jgi:AraC family transcriptional regulator, dual regulator of chb operon
MNHDELERFLRRLDEEEERLKAMVGTEDERNLESVIKKVYSTERPDTEWTINSEKLMKQDESFAIHKHKRYVAFKEHRHDYLELIYVLSGQIKQRINGREVYINKGQLCLLDQNVTHSIEPSSENDIAVNIVMRKEFFNGIFMGFLTENDILSDFIVKAIYHKKEYREHLIFNSEKSEQVQSIMRSLLCEYFDKKIASDTAIQAYILLLFTEMLRIYKENMGQTSVRDMNKTIITEVRKYLCKNYKEANLKDTAEYFHFNPDYLGKLIKSSTGLSFTELLQEVRLGEACMLLENSKMAIEEIVNSVGYNNLSYFYKLFKRKYKVTPIEFRNKNNMAISGQ